MLHSLANAVDQNLAYMQHVMPCRPDPSITQIRGLADMSPLPSGLHIKGHGESREGKKWHLLWLHPNKSKCSGEKHALQAERRVETRVVQSRKW